MQTHLTCPTGLAKQRLLSKTTASKPASSRNSFAEPLSLEIPASPKMASFASTSPARSIHSKGPISPSLKSSRDAQEESKSGQDSLLSVERGHSGLLLDIGPAVVIFLNTIAIGISVDLYPQATVWKVLDVVFAVCYILEFALKVRTFGLCGYFGGADRWWNFCDFLCALFSISEVLFMLAVSFIGKDASTVLYDMTLLKVFRLVRLVRTIRAIKNKMFSELSQIVMGISNGIVVLSWAIALLFGVIFVLAVVMRNLLDDSVVEFSSMPAAMFTLFRCFTDGCSSYDGTPLAEKLRAIYGIPFSMGYVLVMMLVTIGIFNMIMAIFLDNAVTSAARRKQKELGDRASVTESEIKRAVLKLVNPDFQQRRGVLERFSKRFSKASSRARHHFRLSDEEFEVLKRRGCRVDRDTFMAWLEEPEFLEVLEYADVDISNKYDLFDILDADMGGLLELDEVVTGLMKLRGPVSKNDLVATRLQVRLLTQRLTPP
eukprot:TRINITY_DN10986_c0_g1_i2.p1 TRINITY_DN10986_c0_g1~~TRINITY_DN10986_c0_g1_i2.p1  ORF type:complete len:488 (-),score=94.47 TRINITY_DN10986_c0_g1_i2:24-1487(-)